MKLTIEEKKQPVAKTELLQMAEIVARDKGFKKKEVLETLEEAMLPAVRSKYGSNRKIFVNIDEITGVTTVKMVRKIVNEVSDTDSEISITDARKLKNDVKIGDDFTEILPPVEFNRSMVQAVRQIISKKIQSIERKYQFNEFSNRIGDIIAGIVNRVDYSSVVLDIGRSEGIIRRSELLPNETFKIGDRVKVLLCGLNEDPDVPLLQLSRTHPDFVKKLFIQEVPEVYDGVVTIVAVARDPGSKTKIAVTASDPTADPVGACVGPKGVRVRTVSDELRGEKIDIVKWSDDVATFIINSLAPAHPLRIVIDENKKKVDAIVPDEQLSLAIGRRGQNVRLASRLTGWAINAITEKTANENKEKEQASLLKLFKETLDVDDAIAECLADEGFTSVSEVANSSVEELAEINGFDNEIAAEISDRAKLYIDDCQTRLNELCTDNAVDNKLLNYEDINPELLEVLVKAGIRTLKDIGDLATDELLELSNGILTKSEAEDLIMKIRKTWL